MTFYAINGSPRKNKNTATLLQNALDGTMGNKADTAIETEIIHLYELEFRSCVSCLQCKLLGGKSYGKCAIKDSLTPVMERLAVADGIIFGSPIYFGGITGKMHSFLERFLFQYCVYDDDYSSLAPKRMPTAFIYTMNVTEQQMIESEYQKSLVFKELFVGKVFSTPKVMYAFNTYQVDDYSKYKIECFSASEKARYRDTKFPQDCKHAFEIGSSMSC